jgi:hypothetical protein
MNRTFVAGLTLVFAGVFAGAAPGAAAPGSGLKTAGSEEVVSRSSALCVTVANGSPSSDPTAAMLDCVLDRTEGAATALANPEPVVTVTPLGSGRCNVKVGSSATGGMLCSSSYGYGLVQWNTGRWELFIIGWDRAMWHVYQPSATSTAWSSWQSMGGGFTAGPYIFDYAPLQVAGNGLAPNQSKYYCKHYSSGWSPNWYQC